LIPGLLIPEGSSDRHIAFPNGPRSYEYETVGVMITSNFHVENLAGCFPSPEEIPPAFQARLCREERLYLLDGQIRPWEGALMKSGNVDVLALIGSSRAADTLKREHPRPHRLRSILGLDAKNPALVMADADLDVAVRDVVTGALSFNGQRCTGLKLTCVRASIVDAFFEKLSQAVSALPIGMPWDENVKLTPMPEFHKAEAMRAFVEDAMNKGARIVNAGGGMACETLYFPAVAFCASTILVTVMLLSKGPSGPGTVRPCQRAQ
jgi:acyl-CoA reductase-like NAD-dependent aldehyde dehydrogenase